MRENPKPLERYRHFKGNLYQIMTLAKDSETMEDVVVYQALYGDYQVYVRPLAMFMSEVDHTKYPQVQVKYRFEKENKELSDNEKKQAGKEIQKDEKLQINQETSKDEESQSDNKEECNKERAQSEKENQNKAEQESIEDKIDPAVMEFLEAETYEEKLRILVSVRSRITDDMINTMAVASDIEVLAGPVETRYEELKNCLLTREKYECSRIR